MSKVKLTLCLLLKSDKKETVARIDRDTQRSLGFGDLLLPAPSQRLRGGVQPLEPPELTDSEGVEALGENTGYRA